MIQVSSQRDWRSISRLTADYQISVREVEGLIANLKIRCFRLNGILHVDANGAKRIAAELRKGAR